MDLLPCAEDLGTLQWGLHPTWVVAEKTEGSTSWLRGRVRITGKRILPNCNLSQLETNLILLSWRNALCPCAFPVKRYSEMEVLG